MKLAGMALAAILIAAGLLWHDARLVVAGAVIHLIYGIVDLYFVYADAKRLRDGVLEAESPTGFVDRAARWTQSAVTFTGLVLFIVTQKAETSGYAVAGWIIWGGAVVCYLVSGFIARDVGGILLSMGYGGWKVRRRRNGRYWR